MGATVSRSETRVVPFVRRQLANKNDLRMLRASPTIIWEPPRQQRAGFDVPADPSDPRTPRFAESWPSPRSADSTGWHDLPAELLVQIFQQLSADDIRHVVQVCRRWGPIAWSCQPEINASRFAMCFRDSHLVGIARYAERLTTLDLRGCYRVTLDGLKPIGRMLTLRSLTLPLPRFPSNAQDYPMFSPLPNLAHMELCEDRGPSFSLLSPPMAECLAQFAPNLLALHLTGFTLESLRCLEAFGEVRGLRLEEMRWEQSVVVRLPHLMVLLLDNGGMDDSIWRLIETSSELREISLRPKYNLDPNEPSRPIDLRALRHLAKLKLRDVAIERIWWQIPSMTTLVWLTLKRCQLDDYQSVGRLASLTRLTKLNLRGNDLGSYSILPLLAITSLTSLSVPLLEKQSVQVCDLQHLHAFSAGVSLRKVPLLYPYGSRVTRLGIFTKDRWSDLCVLRGFPVLESLRIVLQDEGTIFDFAGLQRLTKLAIINRVDEPLPMDLVYNLTTLRSLHLSRGLPVEEGPGITRLQRLREIHIHQCEVAESYLQGLSKLPIVKMTFQRCQLVTVGLHEFRRHRTLREIKFIHSRDVAYWGDLRPPMFDRHMPKGCPNDFRVRYCTDVLNNDELTAA